MSAPMTRGVIFIHSASAALCPHLEWAIEAVLGGPVKMDWSDQHVAPGLRRAEISWTGPQGTGATLASSMRGWQHLRFEITEEPSEGCDGSRWSFTPDLGIFHATVDVSGNIMVGEERIRWAYEKGDGNAAVFFQEMSIALGEAWDEELEPFRHAGEDIPVRWLNQVV
ncbi:hypothetical protein CQ010_12450 [Arthrobacter sp. MYb211]|uniref:DUF3145 domain-containing protein n=1 Tax=unclassified Arthrobacter TaxID=235627 RepID=UPI000CFC444C|nr:MULTISPECIES: DUF3145 domain-containing protein [unclassified Arthrobacter]PRA06875.1 hypothetical protein CQ019_05870 [Arthrobacter sp. MYb229]PRA14015.1 hypothetical protein CQ015_01700 [Arthrobacter sp. MYb221]PRB53777.1 hypothetical protein CQ013_05870 [Arthrobacter sp. MYb216]PRC06630.1 hypothetical protein CQ010_12450 [Arthrobacter sp. MYb211]